MSGNDEREIANVLICPICKCFVIAWDLRNSLDSYLGILNILPRAVENWGRANCIYSVAFAVKVLHHVICYKCSEKIYTKKFIDAIRNIIIEEYHLERE
jgi:hypothetical protein